MARYAGIVVASVLRVVSITHADEPLSVALEEFAGAGVARPAGQADLHWE